MSQLLAVCVYLQDDLLSYLSYLIRAAAPPVPCPCPTADHSPNAWLYRTPERFHDVESSETAHLDRSRGTTACRPLSGVAVRLAFKYFDKDCTGLIQPVQLEAGLQALGLYPHGAAHPGQ